MSDIAPEPQPAADPEVPTDAPAEPEVDAPVEPATPEPVPAPDPEPAPEAPAEEPTTASSDDTTVTITSEPPSETNALKAQLAQAAAENENLQKRVSDLVGYQLALNAAKEAVEKIADDLRGLFA